MSKKFEDKDKNTYYQTLSRYCRKEGIPMQKIRDYLGYKGNGLESFLNKNIGEGSKMQKRNLKLTFTCLYVAFNIPPYLFGFSIEDTLNEKYQKEHKIKWSSVEYFLHLKVGDSLSAPKADLIKNYPNTLKKYISESQSEIWVHDYYVSDAKNDKHYRESHSGHYQAIEKQMASVNTINYHRLLAFPYHPTNNPYLPLNNRHIDLELIVKTVVKLCSHFTFSHIVNCYKNFEDRFHLSIADIPFRLYSYAIIDHKYILSEYLRYKVDLTPVPDLLFVDRITKGGFMNELRDIYTSEIKKKESSNKISKGAFIAATRGALKDIKVEIVKLEKEIGFQSKSNDQKELSNESESIFQLEQNLSDLRLLENDVESKVRLIEVM